MACFVVAFPLITTAVVHKCSFVVASTMEDTLQELTNDKEHVV